MKRFDLARDTIFVTRAGSHAHGTAQAGSDVDLRGIGVAPLEQRVSFRESFEQWEGDFPRNAWPELAAKLDSTAKVECTIYDIAKLVTLAANQNPNALEILFADPGDWLWTTDAWQRLHAERHRFLSRRAEQTYVGYAMAQLSRIRTHRGWLLQPPERRPSRADFGLPDKPTLGHHDRQRIEQAIAARIEQWGLGELELSKPTRIALRERMSELWQDVLGAGTHADDVPSEQRRVAAAGLGIPADVFRALERERTYRAALAQWEAYERWKRERNPRRAELEARHGYDTKHAMHLIRLMRSGLELLEHGELRVRRKDAADLIAIREGRRSYDDVVEEAEALRAAMSDVRDRSPLPPEVDAERLDALLFEIVTAQERA